MDQRTQLRQKIKAKRDERTGAARRAAADAAASVDPAQIQEAMDTLGVSPDAMKRLERSAASGASVSQLTETLVRSASIAATNDAPTEPLAESALTDEEAPPPPSAAIAASSDDEAPPPATGNGVEHRESPPPPYVPRCERRRQKQTGRRKPRCKRGKR